MRTSARLAAVAAATGLVLSGGAAAQAALPGTGGANTVVNVDNKDVTVTVGVPDVEAGTVEVELTNNSANAYTCNVSKEANTVTEAALVDAAMTYYRTNVYPGTGGGLVDTGSLTSKLGTSSLAPLLGGVVDVPLAQLQAGQKAAQIAGHFGEFPNQKLPAKTGDAATPVKTTVKLMDSAVGPRTEFRAGAVVLCTKDDKSAPNNTYAFAGKSEAPKGGDNNTAAGGSLSLGSLGS